MSEKKTILRYIGWFTNGRKILAFALLLLGLGLAAMAIWVGSQPLPEPALFDALADGETHYAYMDVVGVSDWIAQYGDTSYYILEDSEHLFNAAIIPGADYSRLSHQNLYFNEETDEVVSIRLTGMNKPIPDKVRGYFLEVLDLGEEDFEAYFGHRLFVVGESPKSNATTLWGVLAGVTLAAALTVFLIALAMRPAADRAVRRLEERGLLEQAAAELESSATQQELNDRIRIGSRFLFGRGSGLAAAWDDVLWCYRASHTYQYAVTVRSLVVCTADKKSHKTSYRKNQDDRIVALMERFAERNPEMLLGYSADRLRAYREACKQESR